MKPRDFIAIAILGLVSFYAWCQKPNWAAYVDPGPGVTITGHVEPGTTLEIAGKEADIWPHIAADGSYSVRLLPNDALHPYAVFYRYASVWHPFKAAVREYRWIVPQSTVPLRVDQVQKEVER